MFVASARVKLEYRASVCVAAAPSSAQTITPSRLQPPPTTTPQALRTLYPAAQPLSSGHLRVSSIHSIYYETYGNPRGVPAVFLHGGPGAGCYPNHARFFDLRRYHVVLLDQRGCGRSLPRGCLQDNHTQALVGDLELLRQHLRLPSWLVLGGSWGSALAMAYAQRHPTRVLGVVLRGVCLMRPAEVDWMFRRGASVLRPLGWQALLAHLGGSELGDPLAAFYQRLLCRDSNARDAAARAWSQWEMAVGFTNPSQLLVWDGAGWQEQPHPAPAAPPAATPPAAPPAAIKSPSKPLHAGGPRARLPGQAQGLPQPGGAIAQQAAALQHPLPPGSLIAARSPAAGVSAAAQDAAAAAGQLLSWHAPWQSSPQQLEQLQQLLQQGLAFPGSSGLPQATVQALLECHYSVHGAFLLDEPLLSHVHALAGGRIPCIAVQGQCDLICPPGTAFDLHRAWPEMELRLVPGAGHSMYDPAITHELVGATERMLQLVQGLN